MQKNFIGGHPMAVGIGLRAEKIEDFHIALEKHVREELSADDLEEFIAYDGETTLGEIDDEFFKYLSQLAPFGHSNPRPLYRFNNLKVIKRYPVGRRHTRGFLVDRIGHQIEFIAFNVLPDDFSNEEIDILASPQLNNYYNVNRPQLNILDFRTCY